MRGEMGKEKQLRNVGDEVVEGTTKSNKAI